MDKLTREFFDSILNDGGSPIYSGTHSGAPKPSKVAKPAAPKVSPKPVSPQPAPPPIEPVQVAKKEQPAVSETTPEPPTIHL